MPIEGPAGCLCFYQRAIVSVVGIFCFIFQSKIARPLISLGAKLIVMHGGMQDRAPFRVNYIGIYFVMARFSGRRALRIVPTLGNLRCQHAPC